MGQNWALCERLEAGPHPAGHHIATDQGHDVDAVGGAGGHVVGPPYAELVVGWPGMVAVADYWGCDPSMDTSMVGATTACPEGTPELTCLM